MNTFKSAINYKSLTFWLFVAIVLSAFAKIFLGGKGFLAFPDETRVFGSANFIASLADGNITQAIADLFSTKGRPGAVIMNIIPVGIQYVSGKLLGLSTFQPVNTWPFFLVNYGIYLGILWLQYRIARLLLKNRNAALIAVLIFCCLTNSYVYLRHALPYDKSLIIFYYLLYRILKKDNDFTQKQLFGMGALALFGFLVYPGYILLYALVIGFMLVYRLTPDTGVSRLQHLAVFLLGGGIVLGLTEALSRVGGVSYLGISSMLSGTIVQGDFSESFVFLPKYLFEVEGVIGVLIIIAVMQYFFVPMLKGKVFKTISRLKKSFFELAPLTILFLGSLSLILIYATAGFFFEKVTFYGRLIHQMMPLLCVFAAAGILYNFKEGWQTKIFGVMAIVACVNFAWNFIDYLQYDYPQDVAWEFKKTHPEAVFEEHCELANSWSMITNFKEQQAEVAAPVAYQLVNACYFYPVPPAGF